MEDTIIYMKRRPPLLKLIVFVLLGAIVNVAVAAWFQFHAPNTSGTNHNALSASELDSIWQTHGIGEDYRRRLNGWRLEHFGATVTRVGNEFIVFDGNEGGFNTGGAATFILILETGFPMCVLSHSHADTMIPWRVFVRPATAEDRQVWLKECHVIWPGFAINTVFYAVILWGLFAAPFALRRYVGGRRIKRGLCPACAYPIGSSANCTECGKPVSSRRDAGM